MKSRRQAISILIDSGLLLSVGIVVQITALLLVPWISRIYSPDTLGQLGLILSIATLLSIAIGGRYEQALVVCQEPLERSYLLRLTLCIISILTVLLLAITPLAKLLIEGSSYESIQRYLLIIPLLVALLGLYATLSSYALGVGLFKRIALSKAIQGFGNNALKVGLGIVSSSLWSLLGAQLLSTLISLMVLVPHLGKGKINRDKFLSKVMLRAMAHKYRAFPLFSLPQATITTLLGSILILLLPIGYSTTEVGVVTMATMLARRPVQLVADSISQVYFNRLSVAHHRGAPWRPLIRPLLTLTLTIGLPIILILWWAMPHLISLILASEYVACTAVIRAMLLYLLILFFSSIINVIPDIIGYQRGHLKIQSLNLLLQVGLLCGLIACQISFSTLITIYYLITALYQIIYSGWLIHLVWHHDRQISIT